MTVFEAYITNLGKYAEGQLVGETLKFPATTEEVQSLLKNIGVDGVRYEEFFITAFDGDVMGLYDYPPTVSRFHRPLTGSEICLRGKPLHRRKKYQGHISSHDTGASRHLDQQVIRLV